jgi:hypothetical protein
MSDATLARFMYRPVGDADGRMTVCAQKAKVV